MVDRDPSQEAGQADEITDAKAEEGPTFDDLSDGVRSRFDDARRHLEEAGAGLADLIQSVRSQFEARLDQAREELSRAVSEARESARAAAEEEAERKVAALAGDRDREIEERAREMAELRAEELAEEKASRLVEDRVARAAATALPAADAAAGAGHRLLREAIIELDRADSQAEVLSRLLEQCGRFAGRSALLLASDQNAQEGMRVWNSLGFGDASPTGSTVQAPAAWGPVVAAERTLLAEGDAAEGFAHALGIEAPASALVTPFVLRDAAYAVLYVDDGGDGEPGIDADALQILCFVASQSMEGLALRSTRPSATLTDAEAATAEAPEEEQAAHATGGDDPADFGAEAEDDSADAGEPHVPTSGDQAISQLSTPLYYATPEPLDQAEAGDDDAEATATPLDLAADEDIAVFEPAVDDRVDVAPVEVEEDRDSGGADPAGAFETVAAFDVPSSVGAGEAVEALEDSAGDDTDDADNGDGDEGDTGGSDDAVAATPPDWVHRPSPWKVALEGDTGSAEEAPTPPPPPPASGAAEGAEASEASESSDTAWGTRSASFVTAIEDRPGTEPPPPPTPEVPPPLPPLDSDDPAVEASEEPADDADDDPASSGGHPSDDWADGGGSTTVVVPSETIDATRNPPEPSFETGPVSGETSAASAFETLVQPPTPRPDEGPMEAQTVAVSTGPEATTPPAIEAPPPAPPAPDRPAREASTPQVTPPSAPPEPPPAAGRGSTEVAPPSDLAGPGRAFAREASSESDPRHDEARRLARLLVSELKLYNEREIAQGRRLGNIYQHLREDIDRSRRIYDERIDADIREQRDFLREELVSGLADGDESLLGM